MRYFSSATAFISADIKYDHIITSPDCLPALYLRSSSFSECTISCNNFTILYTSKYMKIRQIKQWYGSRVGGADTGFRKGGGEVRVTVKYKNAAFSEHTCDIFMKFGGPQKGGRGPPGSPPPLDPLLGRYNYTCFFSEIAAL